MSVELRLLDQLKLNSKLCINFSCEYSEDNRTFIISDAGIYILTLRGYLSNPFPGYSCKNDFLKVSDFIPSTHIGIDINSFHKDLDRIDLYETTMSVEYSANVNNATPVETAPLGAQWSPRGIVGKTDCLLATVTNLYSLEVYVKYVDESRVSEYVLISNITEAIINVKKEHWKYADRLAIAVKLNEMKKRVQSISCTAFTWSHLYEMSGKKYCAIFVGHMNGEINILRLEERPTNSKEESKVCFLGSYKTRLRRITRMHWHYTREYSGGLSFADSDGKMSVLHIQDLDKNAVNMDSELAFITEMDNVAVEKITVMVHDNRTYIIIVKQCFIIIYGLRNSGVVFDNYVCKAGQYYITGIHLFENIILVLSLTGTIKQYKLSVVKERIHVEEKTIPTRIDPSKYRTHGFFFSKHMVLVGILTFPCKLRHAAKPKTLTNVLLFHNNFLNPLNILWNNTSGSLRDYWDCFEALRLLCLKDKRFPWLGLPPDLAYDNLSLLQLKTLRCLAQLSEMVSNIVPVIKNYHIKPYIILHYLVQIKLIVKRLNRLLTLRESGEKLSLFQMRSIDIQNFYLKEMVVKNVLAKANVGTNFIREMKQVMAVANEVKYPPMPQCVWCGEKIIGPVCLPPHADSRCSVSMMPIFLAPAYKCPFCKSLAHSEVEKEEEPIFCCYCDIPMEKLHTEEIKKENVDTDFELNSDEVKSACFDDCLNECVKLDDIEENETEYVILSDDECESEDDVSKLRILYLKMKNMSLEEIVNLDEGQIGCEAGESEAGPSRKLMKLSQDDY